MVSVGGISYGKTYKQKLKARLKELKDLEWELTDEQGYWGSEELQNEIDKLEELLGEKEC